MVGGILLYLLAAVGMGRVLSSISATLQQALLGAFLFMVPAVILSGFATPIENMPRGRPFVSLCYEVLRRHGDLPLCSVFTESALAAVLPAHAVTG